LLLLYHEFLDKNFTGREFPMQIIDRTAIWTMKEHPFLPVANPIYFFAPAGLRGVLRGAWNTVDQGLGLGIVFGDAGSGKSMLCRKIAITALASPERYRVAVIGNTHSGWTGIDLIGRTARQFGLPVTGTGDTAELDALYDFLARLPQTCRALLLIDDAHLLVRRGALEALRLLARLEMPTHKPLTTLCFARPGWLEALRSATEYLDLAGWTARVPPLSREDLAQIIDWRMKTAEVSNRAGNARFELDAIAAIHAWSRGLIRPAIHACRLTLDYAIDRKRTMIDGSLAVEALAEDPRFDTEAREQLAMTLLRFDQERTGRGIPPSGRATVPAEPSDRKSPSPTVVPEAPSREVTSSRDRRAAELLLRAAEQRKMKRE